MTTIKLKQVLFFVAAISISLSFSCDQKKGKKHHKKDKEQQTASSEIKQNVTDSNPKIDCDTSMWKYVYNPSRLQIIDKCKTVTGIIEESSADEDGDQHMLLKLDKGQGDILTKRNIKKKQGYLVIEAVCVNKTTLKKVGNTCDGFVNHILIPRINDHVRVTGSLVIDSHNGWAEIHPISKMEVIK